MTNKKFNEAQQKLDKALSSPCTITEAVQIARGVAEDAMSDFYRKNRTVQVATSLQLEIIKKTLIEQGIITEEKFAEMYAKSVEEFNKAMNIQTAQETSPKMGVEASDVEVTVEK